MNLVVYVRNYIRGTFYSHGEPCIHTCIPGFMEHSILTENLVYIHVDQGSQFKLVTVTRRHCLVDIYGI